MTDVSVPFPKGTNMAPKNLKINSVILKHFSEQRANEEPPRRFLGDYL